VISTLQAVWLAITAVVADDAYHRRLSRGS